MRRIAVLGAGMVFASALAAMPINTVLACSCVGFTDGEALAAADAALIGVVMETNDPAAGNPSVSSGDQIQYTVTIEEPLKGDLTAGQQITVVSARFGASCGMVMRVGERWRLLVRGSGAAFTTGLCSGNQLVASGVSIPERSSAGDLSITPPLMILGAGAMGLLALLFAVLFLRWMGRAAI